MNSVCDSMIGLSGLDLYYEAHMSGLANEYIEFSVYFEHGVTDEKIVAIEDSINKWAVPFEENEIFLGYIAVLKKDGKAVICLDYGCIDNCDVSICGILTALNKISDISTVGINEDTEFRYTYGIPAGFDFYGEFYGEN